MIASPRRRQRTHTRAVAAAAVLVLLLTGLQSAAAGPHRVRLVGTYRPVAVDGFGWGRTDHYLESGGETYLMQRGGDFPPFDAGARVEVDGTLNGTKLQADAVEPVPGSIAAASAQARTAPRLATDTRKVLAILVNWTAPDSVTKASAVHQLEDLNDVWYDDASYGQVRMTADATNWLTIPTPSGCDATGIMTNAFNAATSDSWNLSAYDHLLVYFPNTSACGWAGMAYVGGSGLWVNGYMDTRVTVHELGHNLGLWHAHSVTCTETGAPVPWSTSCSRSDYGDPFDAMGGSFWGGVGRFNAAQADELGWMQGRKKRAASGRTYKVAPLGKRAQGLQALRLPGSDHVLWVEYRKATGVDSWLPGAATRGVMLRVSTPTVQGSDLIDLTPGDGDFLDAPLQPGSTWEDPVTGWKIHVNSAGPSAASVTVSKPTDTLAPTFTIAPYLAVAAPQRLPKRGKPARVRVSWMAKDTQGAIAGYDVRVAADGGAWATVTHDDPAVSASIDAAPGHTYAVQVRAADGSGNQSGWVDAPPISLTMLAESRLTYAGRWTKHHDRRALGNTYRVTTRANASAKLHTTASAVALLARVGPAYGAVRVFIDGRRMKGFSQHASKNGYRLVTFRIAWRSSASHTIRFVNVGRHGRSSFSIDSIALLA